MSSESHVDSVLSLVRQACLRGSASEARDNPNPTVAGSTTPSNNAVLSIVPSTAEQTDTFAVPEKRPTSFFDLPPEVRIMIYEYCVLDDKIRPYEYANKRMKVNHYRTPKIPPRSADLVTLSKVCRRTRMECEPMIYGKNTILLPGGYLALEFFDKCLHNEVRRSWVKSIEIYWSAHDIVHYDNAVYLANNIRDDKRPGGKKGPEKEQQDTLMPEERLEMGKLVYEAYEDHGTGGIDQLKAEYRQCHLPYPLQCLFARTQVLPEETVWEPIMAFVQQHLKLERLYFHLRPLARTGPVVSNRMIGHGMLSFRNGFRLGMPKLILADPGPEPPIVADWNYFSRTIELWTKDPRSKIPTGDRGDPNEKYLDWLASEDGWDGRFKIERERNRGKGLSFCRGWVRLTRVTEGQL